MHIVLGVVFGMLVAGPVFGRWRAKLWLKKNVSKERKITRIPQPKLRRSSH
jgi:hypothetical protein